MKWKKVKGKKKLKSENIVYQYIPILKTLEV